MIIACDIDHTIRHSARRDDMIPYAMESGEWDEYHLAGKDDWHSIPMLELLFALHNAGHEIYIVTAIPRKWLRQTYSWLHRGGIKIEEDHMLMRADDNFRDSVDLKLELLADIKIDLLIEDRLDVIEAFAKLGVTTLQVRLVQ